MSGWCSSEKEKNPRRKIWEIKIPNKGQCGLTGKTKQILTVKEINNIIQFMVLKK